MKKTFVLVVLFILPLVAYMFFASGVNNFGRLPTLTENIQDLEAFSPEATLNGKISILGFLGYDSELKKGNAFNLNQKIYKPFYEFRDFQMVMVLPNGSEEKVAELKKELAGLADVKNWKFIYGEDQDIKALFNSLESNLELDEKLGSHYVFIIDKERNLRGRSNDEDEGLKYGFDATSVADLNNKMEDDVKVILAEYRLALKKNNAKRD
ncbi:hypothetical protein LVD13_13990 [Flavobacteriaceae bacterium D16]|nr:hypothetical protein [Flavobacteriaceae bacterium D16]